MQYSYDFPVYTVEATNDRSKNKMTISNYPIIKSTKKKGTVNMGFVSFILEQVAKVLDLTEDAFEAGIIREIASLFPRAY